MKFFTNFGFKNGDFNQRNRTHDDFLGEKNLQEIGIKAF
jgi:hypothetical protein